jgi:hypothetical protein
MVLYATYETVFIQFMRLYDIKKRSRFGSLSPEKNQTQGFLPLNLEAIQEVWFRCKKSEYFTKSLKTFTMRQFE